MWQRVRMALVLLLAGTLLNVGVGWGAVLRLGHQPEDTTALVLSELARPAVWNTTCGAQCVRSVESIPSFADGALSNAGAGPYWWSGELVSPKPSMGIACGWPMLSLKGWHDDYLTPSGKSDGVRGLWSPDVERWPHWLLGRYTPEQPPTFPYLPIGLGFVVNTLFYAGALWLLFCCPGFVRARVRSWRRQCHRCGYPRGESSTCPECGAAVKPLVAIAPMAEWHALREKGPED